MGGRIAAFAPILLSVLRIVTGLLFLEHGTQKFLSFPAGQMAGIGPALANPVAYAGLFELSCGALVTLGLFTRPAAFVASGVMAVAYWMVHFPRNPFPVNNMGDPAILYSFIFLYLAAAGAGPWSLDAQRGRGAPPQA